MQSNKTASTFTRAYALIRPGRLLRFAPVRQAYIAAYFAYKRFVEDPFWNLTKRHPELFTGNIVDVGANIGYTAFVFAKAAMPPGKVYAFEPDKSTFNILKNVIAQKRLAHRIEPVNSAIGSRNGEIQFWHNEKHPADHRVVTEEFKHRSEPSETFTTIPITTIDSFVAERALRNISFIKIDVQGYELAVCEGMRQTLEEFPDAAVCLEYCPKVMHELGFEPTGILDFFDARGYQRYSLAGPMAPVPIDRVALQSSLQNTEYIDLLFSRRALSDRVSVASCHRYPV